MQNILETARRTLQIEANALTRLAETVDLAFARCVQAIHAGGGRIIVTGIGKTAIVAQKIVATFNSTGSPALFLHAGDAIHGDIGMVQTNDCVLMISRSGETAEIDVLSLLVRERGNLLIAMTSRPDCTLARRADHVLLTPFEREADPNELAPTTSTTLQMALGDALAICLLQLRGFGPEDFARFHPGGSLGKQLYLKVDDIYPRNQRPEVTTTTSLEQTLYEMTSKCLGATAVLDPDSGELTGIITDGDLRRYLSRKPDLTTARAGEIMSPRPRTVRSGTRAVQAMACLRENEISQLIVVDDDDRYLGFVHLHDFVREGMI
jgi:arabinose-5-phosphate isomerase